jgi:hypothetical protein
MKRVLLVMIAAAIVTIAVGWYVAARVPRWLGAPVPPAQASAEPAAASDGRKIRASLFYVSEDGTHMVAMPREVPFADTTAGQARRIVEEQLQPPPPPYASALPADTTVRAVFLTDRQEAYVDLSAQASTAHTGGSLDELFSVYTIVNALTVNLPAIERVQILIDGKEVDSLAGHVDLRRPLPRNLTWVARPETPPAAGTSTPGTPPSGAPGAGTPDAGASAGPPVDPGDGRAAGRPVRAAGTRLMPGLEASSPKRAGRDFR